MRKEEKSFKQQAKEIQRLEKEGRSNDLLSGRIVVPLLESSFGSGGMCDLSVPADCNLIVVSTNNGAGWRPRMMLLPHQLYRSTVEELLKEAPDTRWIGVHPVRSGECIDVWKDR